MINGIFDYIKIPYLNFTDITIGISDFIYNLIFKNNIIFDNNSSNFKKLIIGDGIVLAYIFIKDLFLLKLVTKQTKLNITEKKTYNEILNKYKESIIDNYNEIYILTTIERYIFYFLISNFYHWIALTRNSFIIHKITINIFEIITYLCLIPNIQNFIVKNNRISKYRKKLLVQIKTFVKYYISKQIIIFIKNIHKDINEIRTYNIFILYNYLSYEFVITFIKSYCFVCLLYFFRNTDGGYYYYKAIKLACYYNYGLDFKIISESQSCNIINEVIYYKNWEDLVKIKNAHAIYILVYNKYFLHNDYYDNYINFILCISLWSFILLLKVLSLTINIVLVTSIVIYKYNFIQTENDGNSNKSNNIYKCGLNILLSIICRMYDINEIIWCLLFLSNDIIYNFIYEIVFYTKNKDNFKKAIEYYKKENNIKEYKLSSLF